MFRFDTKKYDFWKVYDTIKHFYPIGIEKDDSGVYRSYPGIKLLESLLVDQIHDTEFFNKNWVSFNKDLELKSRMKVVGTTYGQAPAYSSYAVLNETSTGNLTRTKKLHFFVSLLGPYYTIIGEDENIVLMGKSHYQSTNYLVASPEGDFTEAFTLIADFIERGFPGYRFIPFAICRQTIGGLSVHYEAATPATVFLALFNNHLDLAIGRIIGDELYKSNDWLIDSYVETGDSWIAYPPGD